MKRGSRRNLLMGLAIGTVISIGIIGFWASHRSEDLRASVEATQHTLATETQRHRSTSTEQARRLLITLTPIFQDDISRAEWELLNGHVHPNEIIDRLESLIGQFEDEEDLARLYEVVAQAETLLGHPQRAAIFFERAFELRQDPEMLLTIAWLYQGSGNLFRARVFYCEYIDWPENENEASIHFAEEQVKKLTEVLESLEQ